MNNTARIQASFSLPDVLLEDKIERIGNNQTKMMMPKKRRTVKSSIPRVYAVQVWCMARCVQISGYFSVDPQARFLNFTIYLTFWKSSNLKSWRLSKYAVTSV